MDYRNLSYSPMMYMAEFSAQAVYAAFKNDQRKKQKDKKKKKKEESILFKEMLKFVENSLQSCVDVALDDIFQDWK